MEIVVHSKNFPFNENFKRNCTISTRILSLECDVKNWFDWSSGVGQKTKNPTSTPSVVRNLTPTPPKNLRPLATRHRLLNPAFNCCAQPANNHSCNSSQVCAPVFAHLTPATRTSDAYYDPTGICYMLQDFNKPKKNVYRYQPCINSLGTSLNAHYGSSHSYCQAGFGAAFTKVGWNDMVWILFMILKRYLCLFLAWKQAMLVSFKNYVPQHFCR